MAYYNGELPLLRSRTGPEELAYVPSDATAVAYANVRGLVEHAAALGGFIRIDMEQSEFVDAMADCLSVGIDAHSMPAEFGSPGSEGPIRVTVSAQRRLVGRQVGERLRQFGEIDWAQLFPVLSPQG